MAITFLQAFWTLEIKNIIGRPTNQNSACYSGGPQTPQSASKICHECDYIPLSEPFKVELFKSLGRVKIQ